MGSVLSNMKAERQNGKLVLEDHPWQHFGSIMREFSCMPTYAVAEWSTRYILLSLAAHARETKTMSIFTSAALVSFLKEWALQRSGDKSFWPAQASVMLQSSLPLHSVEISTMTLYATYVAAHSSGVKSPLYKALIAGGLAKLIMAAYGTNSTRFLWTTWSDQDPKVANRLAGIPLISLIWNFSLAFSHSLVMDWTFGTGSRKTLKGAFASSNWRDLEPHHQEIVMALFGSLDFVRFTLLEKLPDAAKLVAASMVTLCAAGAGLQALQLAVLERPGIMTSKSFKLLLALTWLAYSKLPAGSFDGVRTKATSERNAYLSRALTVFFTVQACIALIGDPQKHISTGAHQPLGRHNLLKKDWFGNKYSRFLSVEGPQGASKGDYEMVGCTRATLSAKIRALREGLSQLEMFIRRNDIELEEIIASHTEAINLQKRAVERLSQTALKSPSHREKLVLQDLEDSTDARVALLMMRLERKRDQARVEKLFLARKQQKMQVELAQLEKQLAKLAFDGNGDPVISAHEFGPSSRWYSLRGISKGDLAKQSFAVAACTLGTVSFLTATR